MTEILGLIARVVFSVVLETVWFWWPSDRREYREYIDSLPRGTTSLSRRQWRKAGLPDEGSR